MNKGANKTKPIKRVELICTGKNLSQNRKKKLLDELSKLLEFDPKHAVFEVCEDGTALKLSLPETSAQDLIRLASEGDPRLIKLGIRSVAIEKAKPLFLPPGNWFQRFNLFVEDYHNTLTLLVAVLAVLVPLIVSIFQQNPNFEQIPTPAATASLPPTAAFTIAHTALPQPQVTTAPEIVAFVETDTATPTPTIPAPTVTVTPSPSATPTETAIPVTAMDADWIIQSCNQTRYNQNNGNLAEVQFCSDTAHPEALKFAWQAPYENSFAGCQVPLSEPPQLANQDSSLVFWLRGTAGAKFRIGFISGSTLEGKEIVTVGSDGWQQVSIPLRKYRAKGLDLGQLSDLVFGFEYFNESPVSNPAICIDGIGFGNP